MRVLVVEDEPQLADAIAEWLRAGGARGRRGARRRRGAGARRRQRLRRRGARPRPPGRARRRRLPRDRRRRRRHPGADAHRRRRGHRPGRRAWRWAPTTTSPSRSRSPSSPPGSSRSAGGPGPPHRRCCAAAGSPSTRPGARCSATAATSRSSRKEFAVLAELLRGRRCRGVRRAPAGEGRGTSTSTRSPAPSGSPCSSCAASSASRRWSRPSPASGTASREHQDAAAAADAAHPADRDLRRPVLRRRRGAPGGHLRPVPPAARAVGQPGAVRGPDRAPVPSAGRPTSTQIPIRTADGRRAHRAGRAASGSRNRRSRSSTPPPHVAARPGRDRPRSSSAAVATGLGLAGRRPGAVAAAPGDRHRAPDRRRARRRHAGCTSASACAGPDDEVKELAVAFDSMVERLDRSFDGQRRFVANASHELRTPLTLSRAMVELAMHRRTASDDVRRLGADLLADQRPPRAADQRAARCSPGPRTRSLDRQPVDLADVVDARRRADGRAKPTRPGST